MSLRGSASTHLRTCREGLCAPPLWAGAAGGTAESKPGSLSPASETWSRSGAAPGPLGTTYRDLPSLLLWLWRLPLTLGLSVCPQPPPTGCAPGGPSDLRALALSPPGPGVPLPSSPAWLPPVPAQTFVSPGQGLMKSHCPVGVWAWGGCPVSSLCGSSDFRPPWALDLSSENFPFQGRMVRPGPFLPTAAQHPRCRPGGVGPGRGPLDAGSAICSAPSCAPGQLPPLCPFVHLLLCPAPLLGLGSSRPPPGPRLLCGRGRRLGAGLCPTGRSAPGGRLRPLGCDRLGARGGLRPAAHKRSACLRRTESSTASTRASTGTSAAS